jgi:Choline/ethanolamine kinase
VLLRMYGQLHDGNDLKITDSVITMLLSERNLGPKLYGIFPGGRLEEYIPVSCNLCLMFSIYFHFMFDCFDALHSIHFDLYDYV